MTNSIADNIQSNAGSHNKGEGILTKASSGVHSAVDSVAGAAEDAARKAAPAIDRYAKKVHQTVNNVSDAAAPTAEWLNEQGEHLKETQKKLVDDASSYITENPLKAAAFAILAGFVLSRIILR
jgi:ElaB/YqjD/DUF883 family membrane-anchored ribosome-binding protein